MFDKVLQLKRKIRFAYTKSWSYHSFDSNNRRWNRKFELSAFIKLFTNELLGPRGYEFIWQPELKVYKNIAPQSPDQMKPIPWIEYCQIWKAENPEWMEVISRYQWIGIRYGTLNECSTLDNDLEPLRKKGLPRSIPFRVLEQLKIKKAKIK